MIKKVLWGLVVFLLLCFVLFKLGPKPTKPNLLAKLERRTVDDLQSLETQIIENERNTKGVRPDNEARIVWADSSKKQKTPYAVVYLPGFSASQYEGAPMHTDFAKRYGANLYLPRLYAHGVEVGDNMLDLTPENYLASAREAVEVAQQLGDKVIVISTSTGGTLSLILASQNMDIAGLIMYAPNIAIADPTARILDENWGLQIARLAHNGSDFHEFDAKDVDDITRQYWTWRYRIECLVSLGSLIDNSMINSTFEAVKCPVFVGAYYKDEENQDPVVSVAAMRDMFTHLGTPKDEKQMVEFPDAKTHVIACRKRSKQFDDIQAATFKFADEVLKMK